MKRQRSLFAEPQKPRAARGEARRAALALLLENHRNYTGMVFIGKGKAIDWRTFHKLEADGLAVHDGGDPGHWAALTTAGVEAAERAEREGNR